MAAPLARTLRLAGLQAVLSAARRAALTAATALLPAGILAVASAMAPPGAEALRSLRAWCVGPSPGVVSAALFVLVPWLVVGALLAVAREEIAALARGRPHALLLRGVVVTALTGAIVVALSAFSRESHVVPPAVGSTPPLDAPLVDHEGARLSIASLRGRPLLVMAAYSRCSTACPMAFAASDRVLARLAPDERAAVTLVAVTLDPEHDDPRRLGELARARALASPGARLLTGSRRDVEATLDALGIARRLDRATGVIDHDAAFLVLDASGRVVARLPSTAEHDERLLRALRRAIVASPAS